MNAPTSVLPGVADLHRICQAILDLLFPDRSQPVRLGEPEVRPGKEVHAAVPVTHASGGALLTVNFVTAEKNDVWVRSRECSITLDSPYLSRSVRVWVREPGGPVEPKASPELDALRQLLA